MMRSLWTAASGMTSQQLNVDTIAHNLSNVNTTAYKKERLEFKSLLYETMSKANINAAGEGRPVALQIGHGVRPSATVKDFEKGNMQRTDNAMDFAIDGDGFFVVQRGETPEGDPDLVYTRDGSFKLSVNEDGDYALVTADGFYILSTDDEPITIPGDVSPDKILVTQDGLLTYVDADGVTQDIGFAFNIVQFPNRQGLEAVGGNFYAQTAASGEPLRESDGEVAQASRLVQNALEMSNVQVAEEMVKLIVAQRAYEINSKAIQTSDDMLQQANQLKK